jgi:hypothetical protein
MLKRVKKWMICLFALIGFFFFAFGEKSALADYLKDMAFQLGAGYRVDGLDWNIAGNSYGTNSNILSELTWEDLEIYQVRASGKMVIGNEPVPYTYIRGMFGYGWIVDGENQDSDYAGDNRTLEFSRSDNDSDDGDVLDASVGAGFQFRVMSEKLAITPLAGYSYHEQNLTMADGYQTVSRPEISVPFCGKEPPSVGPIEGLDSTYEAQWYGPWLGVDLEFNPTTKFSFFGSFEYHWSDYRAEAYWNLREDFDPSKSFEHEADGYGIVLFFGSSYAFADRWSIDLNLDYQNWKAEDGIDRVFYADGDVSATRLNEVNWESYGAVLGMTYRFF